MHQRATILALLLTTALDARAGAQQADPRVYLRPLQEDATLRDVQFVDAQRGWAVGDRGAIWTTVDGGVTWELQDSGVASSLTSVRFATPDEGLATGGQFQPYTHTSGAVMLRSQDGGRSWQRDQAALLPSLEHAKYFGAHGVALGASSSIFPTGVMATDDAGRSWTPIQGGAIHGWTTGDFLDAFTGALAGPRGQMAAVRQRGIVPSRTPGLGRRDIKALRLTPPSHGWMVGEGGLILWTADIGSSWQVPVGDVAAVAGDEFDWQAVAVRGPRVWIAGSPGTRVVHSADGGRTWESFPTGQSLPLHGVTFVDDQRGWAVGAMGTILATSDGGRTWTRQRGGGSRVAVLGLFSQPEAIPFELLAQLSGNDGYLSHVALLTRSEFAAGSKATETLLSRTDAGLNTIGAGGVSSAWRFPLADDGSVLSADQITAGWDRANDGHGIEQLEAHLVRTIRLWRPDVVVTHAASASGGDPLAQLLNQLVLRAVEQAGDPTRYPEHSAQLGLEAWSVKKVFGRLPDGQLGSVNISTAQPAPRLGLGLAEAGETARGMVVDDYRAAPANVGFQRLTDTTGRPGTGDDVMTGLTLYPGGEARRMLGEPPDAALEHMKRIAQKHRNLKSILERTDKSSTEPLRLAAQMGEMTAGLDRRTAGDVLFQLADHYRRAGQWDLAVEAFERLVNEHGEHPLAPRACVWLMQYWSSSEVAYIRSRPTQPDDAPTKTPKVVERGQIVGQVLPPTVLGSTEMPITQQATTPRVDMNGRWERAVALAKLIEQRYPSLYAEPEVQFPLVVSQRGRGFPREAEQWFLLTTRARPQDAWWACAAGEQWLVRPEGDPPKPMWRVAASPGPPRLDGQLDDPVWQLARAITLHSSSNGDELGPTVLLAAYDLENLYLAGVVRRAPQLKYSPSQATRPRDPDLTSRDRVEIGLDLDRDWTTAFRLVIDSRGWVADECWGFRGWNPQWFVATSLDERSWTFEAAIPLSELAADVPTKNHVWSVGAQRIAPGAGTQSWSGPAGSSASPETFGFLLFE